MNNKRKVFKAIVAIAIALAFILPGAAVFANIGIDDLENNIEETVIDFGTTITTNGDEILWECTGLDWPCDADRLENGNTLITDNSNNRIIEVTSDKNIVWEYSTDLYYPMEANRLENGNTLISDSSNDRIIEVASNGTIVWEYSTDLNDPCDADRLENGNTLISDSDNNRIIEVALNGTIVWEYSTDIYYPLDADRLESGNTLITDSDNSRIIEVDPDKNIVWTYSTGWPTDAERLENDNTLITDCDNNCIIEVDPDSNIVWTYSWDLSGPWDADRLENNNTLITDSSNNRIIEVTSDGDIVWEYGIGLDSPYDADRLENGNTLIADHDNVIEITSDKNIVWEYDAEDSGDADRLENGNTLIAEGGRNERTIEVDPDKNIVWGYIIPGMVGKCPYDADRLENDNTLITGIGRGAIFEVTPGGAIFWEYSTGLYWPTDADRLENGNTLITDCNHDRIIEVDPDKTIVWTYSTGLYRPEDAERLENNNTLITDSGNDRIIEVASNGTIVWEYNTGLDRPADADRLENGNTLITDYYNNRIIEVGLPQYTLTVDIEGNGTVAKDPDQETYQEGTVVNLTANADPGWSFSHWTGNLTGNDNPTNITMDSDKIVTAHFIEDYTLTILYDGDGTVTKDPDQETYKEGTVVNLTANADPGWSFSHWSGNLTGSDNPTNITMDSDKIVTAHFVEDLYPELEIGEISGGFGVSAIIKNIGNDGATDVEWSIKLDGGLIILGEETIGTITSITAEDEALIKSDLILGIGKTIITVSAECAEGKTAEGNANGFVFLFFVLGVQ